MADARSKLEFLYQDVLGDVADLVRRIEQAEDRMPELAEKTNAAAVRLESATTAIQNKLAQMARAETDKALEEARQELANERMRQEAELQKALGAYIAKIGNATNNAVTPAADKLLSVALDAIREREVLAKEKAEHPALLERLARPLLYVAFGAVVATVTTWALNSASPVPGQANSSHQQQR